MRSQRDCTAASIRPCPPSSFGVHTTSPTKPEIGLLFLEVQLLDCIRLIVRDHLHFALGQELQALDQYNAVMVDDPDAARPALISTCYQPSRIWRGSVT
jgi:hypothetical protein